MKQCSRCGKTRPIEDFRAYYNEGRTSTYKYCKECERIETRRKYLVAKSNRTQLSKSEYDELIAIGALYKRRSDAGLDVPGKSRSRGDNSVRAIVDKYLQEMEGNE